MGPGLLCFCPGRAEVGGGASGVGLQRVGLGEAACNRRVSASQLMGRHGEGASTTKRTAALRPSVQGNCRGRSSLPRWQQCSPRCSPPRCTSRCRRSAHSTGYTWHARHGPLCTTSPSGDLLPLGLLEKSQGSKRNPQMGEGFRVVAQPGSSWQRQGWRVSRPCHHLFPHITSRRNGQLGSQTGQWRQSKPLLTSLLRHHLPRGSLCQHQPNSGPSGFFPSQEGDLPSREHPPVGSQCHLFWAGLLVPPPIPPHLLLPQGLWQMCHNYWKKKKERQEGSMESQKKASAGSGLAGSVCAQSLQSCPTLCDPMDCSLPGSSVHGILQARILEWVAMPSSRGSSRPRDRTQVSHVSCTGRQILYH